MSSMSVAVLVSAAAGFVALSYEIVWYRVFSFYTWSAAATFGVLLGVYLLGIALGSFASRLFCRNRKQAGDASELAPLAAFFGAANTLAYFVVPIALRTMGIETEAVVWPLAVALAAGAMGAVLPLTSHFAIAPDNHAGARLSYLYVANIAGSTFGSLLTGFVLLDRLPIAKVCLVISLAGYAVCAALFVLSRRAVALGVGLSAAAASMAIFGGPGFFDRVWEHMYWKDKLEADTHFQQVIENKHGVIAVTTDNTVIGGGAYDGRISTGLMPDRNGIKRAYGLGAMHASPRNVLMIGLASGAWAQVIVNHPKLEHLTAVEINDGYVEIIRQHEEVASILQNPKMTIEIDDGRRWLQRHPERKFDAIVMNTTWNWRAHSTNLLSEEFMQIARSHLEPGGIFYFNTTSAPEAAKTALTVFPHGLRVYNFIAVSDSSIVFDKARWQSLLTTYQIDGKPVLDMESEGGREIYGWLVAWADSVDQAPADEGLERRESMLARIPNARIVTDDDMATEFVIPLRRPEAL
jgi:spermidine synthase